MKKLMLSIVCLLSLAVFAQDTKSFNDANAIVRNIGGSFNAISVSSGIDLYLTQGNEEKVAVSATDENHIARINTELVNGMLKISFDNKGVTWKSNNKRLRAYVSFKILEKLNASAGSEVHVNGSIKTDKLNLSVSSGAYFKGDIQAIELMADVSSGADIKITGKADKLTVEANSGADFNGFDFTTDYCDARASSGAGVKVTINKELNAKASGGADIHYKGTALIRDLKTTGGGAVKKA